MESSRCHTVRPRLTAYLERDLSPRERDRVGRHLAECSDCANALQMTRDLVEGLASLESVELPEGFSQRLRARLAQVEPEPAPARPRTSPERRPFWQWLMPSLPPVRALAGVAVAALVVLTVVVGARIPGKGPVADTSLAGGGYQAMAHPVHVNMGQDAVMKVWFEAAEDVDQVRFTLELPPGVQMVSDDGKVVDASVLTWEGSLKRGSNVIPLHVRGVARGTWTVTAGIEHGEHHKQQSIGLLVNGA